jgi:putative ATPase
MDLFEQHRQHLIASQAPLAARMRPRTLDEFIGQDHIVGPGRLLRRAIQADQLSSLIFSGPPGTGKTTLAQIIANTTHAHFIAINAVLSGVQEIRAAVATAQERLGQQEQRTILFVDEVHRFNKAQQDALLPWVENGTLIFIGATTENPYFEVNKALVSRSRIFQLRALDASDLEQVVQQACQDPDRGYGQQQIEIAVDARAHLVNVANGDARAVLNALELAVETTPADPNQTIQITLAIAEESIQRRAVLYDKEGDAHFDTISALIKSLRGSDPDAALYWLAKMVYAGEDPRFLFRRMLILASEDIGLADPQAVVVVTACAQAFDRMGLPEGHYPLAQAALYLATAPKSNSVMGFFDALKAIEREQEADVPNHLKDANRDKHSFGHGANYQYPHAYRDHWVAQQYLPASLQGQLFYQPSNQGNEAIIQTRLAQQREAQLAAMLDNTLATSLEVLSYSPADPSTDRWLQRTVGNAAQQLANLRSQLFQRAQLQRHDLVLDLHAGSGLLTWEALRQVPEGGVYAQVNQATDADALTSQSQSLPELRRPIILTLPLTELPNHFAAQAPQLRFELIMGRNICLADTTTAESLAAIFQLLKPQGMGLFAETLPRSGQRIYQFVDREVLGKTLYQRWQKAEDAIYSQATQPRFAAQPESLQALLDQTGVSAKIDLHTQTSERLITANLLQRWFDPGTASAPSYGEGLSVHLSTNEVAKIRQHLTNQLLNRTVPWQTVTAIVEAG